MQPLIRTVVVAVALAAITACEGATDDPEAVAGDETAVGTAPMAGMGGMSAGAEGDPLEAHMQRMERASGAELVAMVPQHRRQVANLVAQYSREMREMMPMSEDSEWSQTLGAVREDLVRIPEMSAEELEAFLPEHRARVDRLREMHHQMMGEMSM